MSRRHRRGPTPKRGSRRYLDSFGLVDVRDLDDEQLHAIVEAMGGAEVGVFGDDCPVCRAMGVHVDADGRVRGA